MPRWSGTSRRIVNTSTGTMPTGRSSGGIILCRAADRAVVEALTCDDPFRIHGVADYEIVEFSPTKHLPGFEAFL